MKARLCGLWVFQKDNNIESIAFAGNNSIINDVPCKETAIIEDTCRQLMDGNKNIRKIFDIPLRARGTDFQKSVWKETSEILYGSLSNYREVAKCAGNMVP
ncbi:MAG: hypothetical protein LBI30_02935 [Holosporales bacterium]|jgi:methylated-DNA-[protein]-cysteine S-methyltransferase|nr:hypothetical protein [Holosporales bacterium]